MSNNEILREFLLETHENLALLDSDLIKLELNPTEQATLAQVFRTFHSVKGTAGFMGLVKLQSISHSAENLLSRLRSGEMRYTPPIATALLRVVDAIREILTHVESAGGEGTGDYAAIVAELDLLRETGGGELLPPPVAPPVVAPRRPAVVVPPLPAIPTSAQPAEPAVSARREIPVDSSGAAGSEIPVHDALTHVSLPSPMREPVEARAASVADAAIRVDVSLLDKLMTLVGELVLARNQILQFGESREHDRFQSAVQRLNLLTTELQAQVMKTRMQPIGNVLSKFPRIVRDLALACGKKVRFEMDGQETELDKTLIEAVRDPLTHMIRNAVDHGIESPEIRRSLGKPEEGRLRVVAFHEGGKVIVEITDDGAGIDVARVREKAVAAKLVAPDRLARMSHQEILRLVFLPGFSTADRVTQFSGRGVGMDVVRTNIEKIGGTVDLESELHQGTTVRTKIPLTLAIIPALIVTSGGERYAIPQVSLLELVRLDAEQVARGVEQVHGVPVYRLRGALLPLVMLDKQLRLTPARSPTDDLIIVVVQLDDRPFGLVVDAIRDTEEIVVKPLQKQLKAVSVFAGAAIMGDGGVALVLDIAGLAERAHIKSADREQSLVSPTSVAGPAPQEMQSLLLFASRSGGQMAIPLAAVARLEEFPRSRLERVGPNQLVQYRGEVLPLIDISQELDPFAGPTGERVVSRAEARPSVAARVAEVPDESIPVVVCTEGHERVGLIVDRILDIVHDPVTTRASTSRPGTLFTAVVQDKVTEVVDIATLVRQARRFTSPANPTTD